MLPQLQALLIITFINNSLTLPDNRGFMTAAGQPDQSRSARIMLKEAASGRLRWAQLPPHCAPQPVDDMLQDKRNEKRKPTPMEARMVEVRRRKRKVGTG